MKTTAAHRVSRSPACVTHAGPATTATARGLAVKQRYVCTSFRPFFVDLSPFPFCLASSLFFFFLFFSVFRPAFVKKKKNHANATRWWRQSSPTPRPGCTCAAMSAGSPQTRCAAPCRPFEYNIRATTSTFACQHRPDQYVLQQQI